MDSTPVRLRIALGIIHDPDNARRLLSEIRRGAGSAHKLAVIASKQHLAKYSACFTPVTEAPPFVIYKADGCDANCWKPDDAQSARFRNQLKTFENWMSPTLISRLKSHLEQSALIVAIALDSIKQEQEVCRILLKCAVDYLYVQDVPA